ncbi:MAG: Asp-tRNA(Asn)/Glu-tRNA(Gln) amidotransferase subunit GatA [Leptospiraceae bacterium]|nr:Asp-tRNA(Asn)/Glu-tRNA(Gln) amidotransferase subunit GatA [Leptospiraceae bacterium]
MLQQLARELAEGAITAQGLLSSLLEKIDRHDGKIRAFLAVEREEAMAMARASDARRAAGKPLSPFDGIPVGVKDNIVTRGRVTECASKILKGYVSPFTATAIERLHAKGFVTIGRLNMDEFAMGSSTENSAFQITRNPFDLERAPGGSSGGSAAAVAAGFLPAALGSDTGGSIRQPAAFCGLVGLKPTYGTVSRYGLVAFASSLDQIGPLTHTVDDAAILYDTIKGHDPRDSTTVLDSRYRKWEGNVAEVRLGYDPALLEGIAPEVRQAFDRTLAFLKSQVKSIEQVALPHQKYGIPVYYITATSEASANLARFDGIRYGYRSTEAKTLSEVYEKSRTEGFGTEVKRRILLGTYALSSGYYEAYYGKAQAVRALIQRDYLNAFQKVDALLLPTTPTPAFRLGEKTADPVAMYLSDVLTVGASLAGVPALAVPAPSEGLPVGVQLVGPFFSEELLFALGRLIEKEFPQKKAVL